MAVSSYTGTWKRTLYDVVPEQGAEVWGTGIDPIHAVRAGAPRGGPVAYNSALPDDVTAAHMAEPGFIETHEPWGYQPEDIAGLDVFAAPEGIPFTQDSWPSWTGGAQYGQSTPVNRANVPTFAAVPWQSGGRFKNFIRGIRGGAHDGDYKISNQIPTETVSEGWINKAASGMDDGLIPDSAPAGDDQVFVQTSMVQRYRNQNNERSQQRGTDDLRSPIESRVAPMKIKYYSGEQRHYDMDPYQADELPRPFWYRTAGTGPRGYLAPNDQMIRVAMQRTPPPDPSQGTPDTEYNSDNYGYNYEDVGWY